MIGIFCGDESFSIEFNLIYGESYKRVFTVNKSFFGLHGEYGFSWCRKRRALVIHSGNWQIPKPIPKIAWWR